MVLSPWKWSRSAPTSSMKMPTRRPRDESRYAQDHTSPTPLAGDTGLPPPAPPAPDPAPAMLPSEALEQGTFYAGISLSREKLCFHPGAAREHRTAAGGATLKRKPMEGAPQ